MASDREKLRDELIGMQAAQADIQKWKIIGIGAVFAVGLGFSHSTAGDTSFALFAIPFISVYADLLARDYDLRISVIASFLRSGDDAIASYERAVSRLGSRGIQWWVLGHTAIAVSSVLSNAAVILLVSVFQIPGSTKLHSPLYWAASIGIALTVGIHLRYNRIRKSTVADLTRDASNRFGKAVPSLPVEDCSEAIRFYCDVLGFRKDFDDDVLGRERTLFAGVSRGDCAITLNQHDRQDYRATLGCDVDDVDLLHAEYRSRGVIILLEPQDEPWGERHMAIADLYGHEIHFSSRNLHPRG